MNSIANLIPDPVTEREEAGSSKENLKLWLCELTHLTPRQVEDLMAQMEQQQLSETSEVVSLSQ
jgi:hypothetical protein